MTWGQHIPDRLSTSLDSNAKRIWKDFLYLVGKGELLAKRIQTIDPKFDEILKDFVNIIQDSLLVEMAAASPEIFHVANKLHFILPLGQERRNFTFTFLIEGRDWKFQHVESLLLDFRTPLSLPTSTFPDLPAGQKAWMIAEFQVTEQIRLFNFLVAEKGKDFAFQWFQDGDGYALSASTWIPYYPLSQAFILFLCWEQANLRGSQVTLQVLDDDRALVDFKSSFFELYQRTGHLRTMISFEDYRQLFETIWTDRARTAGWDLEIIYAGENCRMTFSRRIE